MSKSSKIVPPKQLNKFTVIAKVFSKGLFYEKQHINNVRWDFRYAALEALIFYNELENLLTVSLTRA